MSDPSPGGGPLIVQSDKTVLLEVDHPQAEDARRAIAPFAELERSPEHIHTYRLTPAGPVERARGRPRCRAGGRHAARLQPVRRAARPARGRRRDDGPLRTAAPRQAPGARPGPDQHRPRRARGGRPEQEGGRDARRPDRRGQRRRPPLRARQPQAGAAQARLAGRGLRRLRRRRGPRDGARGGRLGPARLPEAGRRLVLARRLGGRRAALRCRQDHRRARPRWRTRRPPR